MKSGKKLINDWIKWIKNMQSKKKFKCNDEHRKFVDQQVRKYLFVDFVVDALVDR